jgi:DnaJ-class molecular chaperone
MRMDCYVADNNDTAIARQVSDKGAGAAEVRCFECDGTGRWPWHRDGRIRPCVDCEGTGKVYVSV